MHWFVSMWLQPIFIIWCSARESQHSHRFRCLKLWGSFHLCLLTKAVPIYWGPVTSRVLDILFSELSHKIAKAESGGPRRIVRLEATTVLLESKLRSVTELQGAENEIPPQNNPIDVNLPLGVHLSPSDLIEAESSSRSAIDTYSHLSLLMSGLCDFPLVSNLCKSNASPLLVFRSCENVSPGVNFGCFDLMAYVCGRSRQSGHSKTPLFRASKYSTIPYVLPVWPVAWGFLA